MEYKIAGKIINGIRRWLIASSWFFAGAKKVLLIAFIAPTEAFLGELVFRTTLIKQWERNIVFGWAGICGKGRNTSSSKNACVGAYIHWDVVDARFTPGFHKICQKKRLFQDMITAYLLKGSVISVFQIIQLWIPWC